MSNPIAEIFDVFFNRRSAAEASGATNATTATTPHHATHPATPAVLVTLEELVRRKKSVIRLGKKYYRIVAEEIDNPKEEMTSK